MPADADTDTEANAGKILVIMDSPDVPRHKPAALVEISNQDAETDVWSLGRGFWMVSTADSIHAGQNRMAEWPCF